MVNCPGISLVWCGPLQPQPGLAETMHKSVKPKYPLICSSIEWNVHKLTNQSHVQEYPQPAISKFLHYHCQPVETRAHELRTMKPVLTAPPVVREKLTYLPGAGLSSSTKMAMVVVSVLFT
jgi:hypothetical protein